MTEETARKSDRWIPWMIVGFFVVVAIFDGIFVYLAGSTHTGVVTDNAYNRGLDYNATVAAAEKQAGLGWKIDLDLKDGSNLILKAIDSEQRPLQGAVVRAEFKRPTQDGYDFDVAMTETVAGTFETPVSFPLSGQWDVRVFVQWKQEQFQQSKRLVVAK